MVCPYCGIISSLLKECIDLYADMTRWLGCLIEWRRQGVRIGLSLRRDLFKEYREKKFLPFILESTIWKLFTNYFFFLKIINIDSYNQNSEN